MRLALIAGGQPRFTYDFIDLMDQIKGFTTADIYIHLWDSSWTENEQVGRNKIEKILKTGYNLSKLTISKQPEYNLPPHILNHPDAQPENVRWAYERRFGMWTSIKRAFELIEEEYDVYIKFRTDGMLNKEIDIRNYDLINNDLIYPAFPRHGKPGQEVCDQFVIGNKQGMKFYCSLVDNFNEYIPAVSDQWENDIHTWASEHLLSHHIQINNKKHIIGDYGHLLTTKGRSKFTDRHYHLPVTPDPTNIGDQNAMGT